MSSILIAQIIKEFLVIIRDKKTRFILIIPPILQLFIFAFAITLEVSHATIAVFNQDSGAYSRAYIDDLSHSSLVKKIIPIYQQKEIRENIDEQKVLLALIIPPDFSKRLAQKKAPILQLISDGRRANAAQIASAYINSISSAFLHKKIALDPQVSPVVVRYWFNPNLSYKWFIVPSLTGLLAMMISLFLASLSIAREKEMGTFDQLLVSPISAAEIISAKLFPAIAIGMLLGNLMIFCAVVFFQLPFMGSLFLLEITLFFFILSIAAIGLCVSAVCNTQQQAILGVFAFVVPLILLSGFATPIDNMPQILQCIAHWNPVTHYLIIARDTFLKAPNMTIIFRHLAPIILVTLVSLIFSTYFIKNKLE